MKDWKKVKLGDLYEVHNGLFKRRQFFGKDTPLGLLSGEKTIKAYEQQDRFYRNA